MKILYKSKWLSNFWSSLLLAGAMLFSSGAFATFTGGIYTIDQGGTASSTVYKSFNDLASDLKSGTRSDGGVPNGPGISGPIKVVVKAGSGPYTEQVVFKSISGTSKTNTITIEGNGETIQFTATSNTKSYTIRVDGGDYFTFDNLVVVANDTSYGRCFHFKNSADNNTIKNCDLQMPKINSKSSASKNHAYIVIGQGDGNTTALGDPGENIAIDSNTMSSKTEGPYSGIVVINESGKTNQVIRKYSITNNKIANWYHSGVRLQFAVDCDVSNNEVYNTSTATSSSKIAIYAYNKNKKLALKIRNNKVHNISAQTSATQTNYGIYVNGTYSLIYGDLVVEGNDVSVDHANTSYGIYTFLDYSKDTGKVEIKNNHVKMNYSGISRSKYAYGAFVSCLDSEIDHVKMTKNMVDLNGTGGGFGVYLYARDQDNNSDNLIANNICNIEKPHTTSGIVCYSNGASGKTNVLYNTVYSSAHPTTSSSGNFYCYRLDFTRGEVKNNIASIGKDGNRAYAFYERGITTVPNFNNNIIDYSRTPSAWRYYGYSGGINYTSMADWQAGNGGSNSLELDPKLRDPDNSDFTPQAFSMVNKGTPVTMVNDDIYGSIRNPNTPEIGAIEFFLDVAIVHFKMIGSNECGGYAEEVTITIRNESAVDVIDIPVAYDINGIDKVQEVVDSVLGPGKTMDYTFSRIPQFNGSTTNIISAYFDHDDEVSANDTQTHIIKTTASPFGANLAKGSTFDAYFRRQGTGGTHANPDVIAPGVEVEYEILHPTMNPNNDYGTGWIITPDHHYESGTAITTDVSHTDPSSTAAGVLTFKPSQLMADSMVWVGFVAHDNNTGCDSSFGRWVYVPHIPNPDFSAADVCDGEMVVFKDKSTLAKGAIVYDWQFNDPKGIEDFSGISNPVYVYSTYGTYDVELTVSSFKYPLFKYSMKKTITVLPVPTIDFRVVGACEGIDVKFGNKSTSPNGETIDYTWNFGDGSTSNLESPSHLYSGAGGYPTTLTGVLNGCAASLTKLASQFAIPKAAFSASGKCTREDIQMHNSSTIAIGKTGYAWNFGDGTVSNLENPTHVYDSAGRKIIKLKTTSEYGCEDSTTYVLTLLEAPIAEFEHTEACNLTDVEFTRTGLLPSGTSIYEWDFADEAVSTRENPSHHFSSVGEKSVSLKITSSNGCSDMVEKTLNVKLQGIAGFEATDACEGDDVVFTNTSEVTIGELDYVWRFGDGKLSNYISPTHRFDLNGGGTKSFSITLIASVEGGCADSITKSVVVNAAPDASFDAAMDGRKLIISNQATTSNDVTYNWRFGDGSRSSEITPEYTYGRTGDYERITICLGLISPQGCISEHCEEVIIDLLGVDDVVSNDMIKVYPNPSTSLFNISIDKPQSNLSIDIVNLIGKKITSVDTKTIKSNYVIDMSTFSKGIYFIQVTNGETIAVKKITLSK